MSPKTLYSLIFWGLVLPIFGFPIGGVALIPAIGFAMIAYATWMLGGYVKPFRVASISAALLAVQILPTPYLPANVTSMDTIVIQGVLGWTLFTCVARDCQAHGHIDIAAAARLRRVAYVLIVIAVPLGLPFIRFDRATSPILVVLPTLMLLLAYVLLVWTVQSAKIRLFP